LLNRISDYRFSGECDSGGGEIRVVHQNHEDEKNSSEFFEAYAEQSKRFFQNRFSSLPIRAVSQKSVIRSFFLKHFSRAGFCLYRALGGFAPAAQATPFAICVEN
jgi:hypothetical protein